MICFGVEANYGLGRHYWTSTDEDAIRMQMVLFIQACIGLIPGLSFLKFSVGLSLLRLSRTNWYRYTIYGLLGKPFPSENLGTWTGS